MTSLVPRVLFRPFKLSPRFDAMLAGVLAKDPQGILVLHQADNPANIKRVAKRLRGDTLPRNGPPPCPSLLIGGGAGSSTSQPRTACP
jgi:hypothetical protein